MTLQQLRYAITIADSTSMNEAAKQLFISQPSLSSSIRDLEEELGMELFIRSSRGITLTPEGNEFIGYARQVMEQYRRASSDKTLTVFVSTASPYKFCGSVLTAIGKTPVGSGLELLDQLHEATGVPVPQRLAALRGKPRRFDKTVEKQAMETAVLDFLK